MIDFMNYGLLAGRKRGKCKITFCHFSRVTEPITCIAWSRKIPLGILGSFYRRLDWMITLTRECLMYLPG